MATLILLEPTEAWCPRCLARRATHRLLTERGEVLGDYCLIDGASALHIQRRAEQLEPIRRADKLLRINSRIPILDGRRGG